MPGTKEELRAEVATLREELAAERAKVEVLREQAGTHHCHGGPAYWCVACNGPRWPGHACTYLTWTSQPYTLQPYTVTCGGAGSTISQSGAATGAGIDATTYTLS